MDAKALAVLLRASKGDALKVVFHILHQSELEQDDHDFLHERLEDLPWSTLMQWLTRKPPSPGRIVDALMRVLPDKDSMDRFFFHATFFSWPARLEAEVVEDIADRLRTRLAPDHWWHFAKHLEGMSPFFQATLVAQQDCHFALHLFPSRRDDMACREALREAAMHGTMTLSSPGLADRIGYPAPTTPGEASAAQEAARKLRARASVVAWLEARGGLSILSPEEALPHGLLFRKQYELEPSPERYFLTLALHWPDDQAPRARAWYVRQLLDAACQGSPWGMLLCELSNPEMDRIMLDGMTHTKGDQRLAREVVQEIAWASLDTPALAPWTASVIHEALERGEPHAWERAFRFLDRCLADPDLLQVKREGRLEWISYYPESERKIPPEPAMLADWIIMRAPLPEGADDAFEARLFDYHERLLSRAGKAPTDLGRHGRVQAFKRRASFPIDRARANRLLATALDDEDLLRALAQGKLDEVVAAADPLPPERLPAPESFLKWSSEAAVLLAAYRRLGGAAADERLRAWASWPLRQREQAEAGALWSADWIHEALWRVQLAPELLLTDDMKQQLADISKGLPLVPALRLQRVAPWLVDEATLLAIAERSAELAGEDWRERGEEVDVPPCLAPAVRRRAQVIESEREFLALARWLRKQGEPPADLINLAVDRIGRGAPTHDGLESLVKWLAEVLASRTLWEQHGPRVMGVLVGQKAWTAIYKLMSESAGRADPRRSEPAALSRLIGAMHEALAVALLRRLKPAFEACDADAASAALQALVALHPPSRLSRKLVELQRLPSPSPEVSELLELNLRLLRKGTTRDATLSDVDAALAFLVEAGGG